MKKTENVLAKRHTYTQCTVPWLMPPCLPGTRSCAQNRFAGPLHTAGACVPHALCWDLDLLNLFLSLHPGPLYLHPLFFLLGLACAS
mmetsp:Transcript_8995/g.13785  ORF Transcript_8995/g.13785 Transcript_8995/m.13785 type:complete len:87 (+) Transcript_8995:233-493(+)